MYLPLARPSNVTIPAGEVVVPSETTELPEVSVNLTPSRRDLISLTVTPALVITSLFTS